MLVEDKEAFVIFVYQRWRDLWFLSIFEVMRQRRRDLLLFSVLWDFFSFFGKKKIRKKKDLCFLNKIKKFEPFPTPTFRATQDWHIRVVVESKITFVGGFPTLPAPAEAEARRCVFDSDGVGALPVHPSAHAFTLLLVLGQESLFPSWLYMKWKIIGAEL